MREKLLISIAQRIPRLRGEAIGPLSWDLLCTCLDPKPGLSGGERTGKLSRDVQCKESSWAILQLWGSPAAFDCSFDSFFMAPIGLGRGLGQGRAWRKTPALGAQLTTCSQQQKRCSSKGLGEARGGWSCSGWEALQGGLGTPSPPFPAWICAPREQGRLGSGLQNKLPTVGCGHGPLPDREGWEGGDESAFVSLCLCQDGNRLPPSEEASRCKGKGSPPWVGGPSVCFFWGISLASAQPPPSFRPSCLRAHCSHQPELWLNICSLRRAFKAAL